MRRIILTGATGGLGRHLVRQIVDADLGELICIYRDKKKFEDIFSDDMPDVSEYLLDENDDFSRLVGLLDENADEIVLILNAFSITPIKPVGRFTSEEIEKMIYGNITRNVLLLNRVTDYCKIHGLRLRVLLRHQCGSGETAKLQLSFHTKERRTASD